ncbi:phosphopantetheine-binding protein [Bacillus halotolerans]|uniref:beta-ketoacyl synthase N-terminal-like domain-containing protein n=1 Tax=Bacillus halotolerans TaxID=260554 RepID=UPI0021183237|nr:beta-ketoacyl synthase N-terminal-like domain-containing protein [Bacillus halotolerans]UUI85040.1 phosphopantetheine-binding protein [Bacillus halotolerans]
MKGWTLKECVLWEIRDLVSKILRIQREKLEADENLADFGFDSVSLSEFANALSNRYDIDITPDVFFAYPTLDRLSGYLLKRYSDEMKIFYQEGVEVIHTAEEGASAIVNKSLENRNIENRRRNTRRNRPGRKTSNMREEPIGIIGMSGRFPDAWNVEELWSILFEGKDVIREAPHERAEWWEGDTHDGKAANRKFGVVPGVDEFDPFFFELSPREAEMMDPRQRLLLQETWSALEDAGYGSGSFEGEKIGMFVGIEEGDYRLLVGSEGGITSNHNAILAARLSYFLNLDGPNVAINTACSSGLVAVHQACQSLRNGECDTAIVAGTNLLTTPEGYDSMDKAGMLSSDGKCYAFDKRANGMVPAEAVAVIVLKRLSKAEEDRNPIYATIVASGINYDGKTNGITAPSGRSQSNLIKEVYERFYINPRDMEYIVTHGTGTKLGDPIEINALAEAFKDYTEERSYCALTSTKPNIGHTLAASGIVSLISLVMSLKKETIPASINCEQVNDYIQWENSPFFINRENRKWTDKEGKNRLGAVSSFGISGTNAHVVLQSYASKGNIKKRVHGKTELPFYLIALSAKTPAALWKKIYDLTDVLEKNRKIGAEELAEISYTMMDGRHHFDHRFAMVIKDREDAVHVLRHADENEKLPNLFTGSLPKDFKAQSAISKFVEDLIEECRAEQGNPTKYRENLFALAEFYTRGYTLSCKSLFADMIPNKVNLPHYPFAKEKYWVPSEIKQSIGKNFIQDSFIHPLVHENTSNLSRQRFTSALTGKEDFLYSVNESSVYLPESAHLEMARVAAGMSVDTAGASVVIKDVEWHTPIMPDGNASVNIALYQGEEDEIEWEIYSQTGELEEEAEVSSEGKAGFREGASASKTDLRELRARFPHIDHKRRTICRHIEEVWTGNGSPEAHQFLIKFKKPDKGSGTYKESEVLIPGVLEACLEAVHEDASNGVSQARLSSVKEMEIPAGAGHPVWGLVNLTGQNKVDITLYDESGTPSGVITGLAYVFETPKKVSADQYDMMTFEEAWQEEALTMKEQDIKTVVVFLTDESRRQAATEKLKELGSGAKPVFIGSGTGYKRESENRYTIRLNEKKRLCGMLEGNKIPNRKRRGHIVYVADRRRGMCDGSVRHDLYASGIGGSGIKNRKGYDRRRIQRRTGTLPYGILDWDRAVRRPRDAGFKGQRHLCGS